jgi:hypothetical protein
MSTEGGQEASCYGCQRVSLSLVQKDGALSPGTSDFAVVTVALPYTLKYIDSPCRLLAPLT